MFRLQEVFTEGEGISAPVTQLQQEQQCPTRNQPGKQEEKELILLWNSGNPGNSIFGRPGWVAFVLSRLAACRHFSCL